MATPFSERLRASLEEAYTILAYTLCQWLVLGVDKQLFLVGNGRTDHHTSIIRGPGNEGDLVPKWTSA